MELFDDIVIEVNNGGWTDITADVCVNPAPKWNCGIMRNDLLARVADPGYFTFSLKNSTANSAGLQGYYSPGHANCWSGWTTGLPVRLKFSYDGVVTPWVKFYGWICPDGITVTPGKYLERTVQVRCEDWIARANRHYLRLMGYQTNLRVDQALPYILANMPVQPYATDYATGNDTFPTVFDTNRNTTTAISEMNKLALSEFGYIYCTSDGTLKFDARSTRSAAVAVPAIPLSIAASSVLTDESGDTLTDESGVTLLADETQAADFPDAMSSGTRMSYGKNLCNQVRTTYYPRKVDAAATTILWQLQSPMQMTSGQTITAYRGTYRDPSGANTRVSGISMVPPVASTHYTANAQSDGGGADKTANLTVTASYGSEAVEYTLTASADLWITMLKAVGKGVYLYDPVQMISSDTTSQNTYGVKELTLDCRYQDDVNNANAFSAYLLSQEKDPHTTVDACPIWVNKSNINMYGFLYLEPGDKITISETMAAVDQNYYIQGYSATIVDGKLVQWSPILIDNPGFYYNNMSIRTDGTTDSYTLWSGLSGNPNIPVASYSFWIKQDGFVNTSVLHVDTTITGEEAVRINVNKNANGAIELYPYRTGTTPSWENRTNLLTLGSWHHVVITYDGTLAATAPLLYVDGVAKTMTEYTPGAGDYRTPTFSRVFINGEGANSINGKLQDVRIYSRILGSTDVTDIYNSQYYTSVPSGLIFQMRGTLEGPDGVQLTGVYDNVSKAWGVVTGTVTASADNKNFY